MTPRRITTRPVDRSWARGRRDLGIKYLEVAEIAAAEDGGMAVNVCVGVAVLAGIAAGDAICAVAIGESYSGSDHAAAADLLERVDRNLGHRLRTLISLKAAAHYGNSILGVSQRTAALRAAAELVEQARNRVL